MKTMQLRYHTDAPSWHRQRSLALSVILAGMGSILAPAGIGLVLLVWLRWHMVGLRRSWGIASGLDAHTHRLGILGDRLASFPVLGLPFIMPRWIEPAAAMIRAGRMDQHSLIWLVLGSLVAEVACWMAWLYICTGGPWTPGEIWKTLIVPHAAWSVLMLAIMFRLRGYLPDRALSDMRKPWYNTLCDQLLSYTRARTTRHI